MPVVLRNAADMYNSLTGGEDPIVSGITRVAQMLQTKQQREEAKKQREFENQMQTEAGQRAAKAAQQSLEEADWNDQLKGLELAQKAASLHTGKREKIPFEERAMLGQDAAMIPDTPEERAAWAENTPTRLKAAETFTVRHPRTGQEYQVPLLSASHLAEKQAEEAKALAKTQREIGVEAGTSRAITPEMIETLRQVNPALATLFGKEGDIVPAAELRGVATQLARPEPAGKGLQHVTRTDAAGNEQYGTFDPSTGAYQWFGGGGGGGTAAVDPGRQKLIEGIASGRVKPPSNFGRSGPGLQLMQDVMAFDPGADFNTVNARWAARQELTKNSPNMRGGQITSLDRLARHIGELEDASDHLTHQGLSDSDYQTVNKLKMMATPKGKRSAETEYTTAGEGVKSEYIKLLSGGRPSVEEQKALDEVSDPTLPPASRAAAIDTLRRFARDQARAQEAWYQKTFGRSSGEDQHPLLDPKVWEQNADTDWSFKQRKRVSSKPPAKPVAGDRYRNKAGIVVVFGPQGWEAEQ